MGHQAGLLNDRALENGIKGWNIPPKYRKCFKVINANQLTSFLYWGTNEDKFKIIHEEL